jgi:hypothetical protein
LRRIQVSETKEFTYETRLNVLCPPLEVIDEKALAEGCTDKWYNQTLCAVNESVYGWAWLRESITGTSTTPTTNSSTLSKADS